ncbi:E3 ubiquitin-protein ligase WAV3-like [Triticum aestivum]|uniref:E3 ubiquitin-protein ligase WAV3-like n=1 Tax=Triticum aestivum TaxID=4565 RepID=UPI001D00900E|nr:E3 ubiquitin-protein ligase WAV3-like [Triticum aestivum]
MAFVVDQLGPADRLSVVSFSGRAARLTCLARMSDAGKASAKLAVDSLVVESGTNIGEGLRVGAQVLVGRRHKNSVASMILLSDGQDSRLRAKRYMDLVPPLFVLAGSRPGPIHTFGFGANHDVAALHTIAQATGGTFSFVGNQAAIQDSFAQCIGGLLSVAVQEARIAVTCLHRGVHVQEVKSGCYGNHVDAEGRAASIDVGELYEDEERRFLVLVYVSRARPAESVTRLIKVTCGYKDAATGQAANAAAPAAVIQRPLELTDMSPPCMEVERERVRLATAQDIAAAREAAEGGQHAGAARILDSRLKAVERSAPGMAC